MKFYFGVLYLSQGGTEEIWRHDLDMADGIEMGRARRVS